MEFRLSDEKVSNVTEYFTELSKYSGEDKGGWMVLRDWLIDNNITYSWGNYKLDKDNIGDSRPLIEHIWKAACDNIRPALGDDYIAGSMVGTDDGNNHGNSKSSEKDTCVWVLHYGNTKWYGYNDLPWGSTNGSWTTHAYILLVRPL